ncbi:hypothetical protein FRC10_005467, partial [Ceratobasidium sp. 414]
MDSFDLLDTERKQRVLQFVDAGLESVLRDMVPAVDKEDFDSAQLQDICDVETVNTMKAFFDEQHYEYPHYQLRLLFSLRK